MLNASGDLAYAARQFRRSPVFTLTAVLTLALGIGGTTAIFSLMHDVMLRSLPVADPGSLYRIGSGNACCVQDQGGPQGNWGLYSYPLFERLRSSAPEFSEVTAFQASSNRYGVLRTHLSPGVLEPVLRKTFADSDPNLTVVGVRTMKEQIALVFDQQRAVASLAG